MLVEQLLGAGLGGVDGDVHGGADGAGAVADGDGDRSDAGRELLVGEGPAAGADPGELLVEVLAGRADVARQPGAGRDREDRVELRRVRERRAAPCPGTSAARGSSVPMSTRRAMIFGTETRAT